MVCPEAATDIAPGTKTPISDYTLLPGATLRIHRNPIPGANGQTFMATQSGNYSVIYEYNFGCVGSDTSDVEFITVSSIEEGQSLVFSVHPNPFSTQLAIDSDSESIHSYSVFTTEGRMVEFMSDIRTSRLVFNTERWNTGVYFVRLTTGSTSATIRVLKTE